MTANTKATEITVVLPVRIFDVESDLMRLIDINLMSLATFFEDGIIKEIIVIASSKDLSLIESAINSSTIRFPLRFLDEVRVLQCLRYRKSRSLSHGWDGWRIQQVLKMLVANFVQTKHYLLLDDDVTATRTIRPQDLFRNGKMSMSYLTCSHHSEWFKSSAAVLRIPLDFHADEIVMNVTPQLISTFHMKNLVQHLQDSWAVDDVGLWLLKLSGLQIFPTRFSLLNRISKALPIGIWGSRSPSPAEYTACRQWTEYTLYWLYIRSLGVHWDLYSCQDPQLADKGVWTDGESSGFSFDRWASETLGESHGHCFCVISSKIANIDRSELYQGLSAYLKNS